MSVVADCQPRMLEQPGQMQRVLTSTMFDSTKSDQGPGECQLSRGHPVDADHPHYDRSFHKDSTHATTLLRTGASRSISRNSPNGYMATPSPLTVCGTIRSRRSHESISFDARSTLRSEEHTSELQSLRHLVCRLLLEKKKINSIINLKNHLANIPRRIRLPCQR